MEHKISMPYTEACIIESLRIISQVPLAGYRVTSSDIDFEGMTIPKNSVIFVNSWHILHDETIWEDPWIFKPERFLDTERQLLPADHPIRKNMIAFGFGVRACPGEMFARSRIFLFITSILQRYDISPPVNEKLIPADFQVHDENFQGLVLQTPDFKCRLNRRERV
uniref:Cytochrome P450 n=1 Tax=Arion vulgaris TaxID=1028688 RepID=A0A0B6ZKM9_9EUPU